jgi:hypothetical protein
LDNRNIISLQAKHFVKWKVWKYSRSFADIIANASAEKQSLTDVECEYDVMFEKALKLAG